MVGHRARRIGPGILAGLLALVSSVLVASAAGAQDEAVVGDLDDQIVLTGRLHVAGGETVGTAVIFNGPAIVEGTVAETLVVFNGRTEIFGTVEEDVVVFNGRVVVGSGANIGGDVVSGRDPQIDDGATLGGSVRSIATRFDFENLGFAGRIAWWIGYSLSTLVLGLLLLLLAPALDGAISEAFRSRLGASIGLGIAGFVLLPISAAIFFVTIVAIPLGFFLVLALALLYTVGYVAGAHAIGRSLVRRPVSRFLGFLAGWGILRLIGLVPFLGGLAWLLASMLGLGLLVVAARRGPRAPEPSIPPPPVASIA